MDCMDTLARNWKRAEWFEPRRRVGFLPRPGSDLEAPRPARTGMRASACLLAETPASGLIGNTGFFRACWYRRQFDAPDLHRASG